MNTYTQCTNTHTYIVTFTHTITFTYKKEKGVGKKLHKPVYTYTTVKNICKIISSLQH